MKKKECVHELYEQIEEKSLEKLKFDDEIFELKKELEKHKDLIPFYKASNSVELFAASEITDIYVLNKNQRLLACHIHYQNHKDINVQQTSDKLILKI